MGKRKLDEINDGWDEEMIYDGYQIFATYQPFTDDYWNQKIKIVFCNLESYDESLNGVLDLDVYKRWLSYNSPTIKFSSIFISALKNAIIGFPLTREELEKKYYDDDYLLEIVKDITYMNLRKEPNSIRKEDTQVLHEFLDPNFSRIVENKHHIRNFRDLVDALEPDLFIISGKTGADIISKIYKDKMNLVYDQMDYFDKTLCVSIAHPSSSKFDYEYLINKSEAITKKLLK